MTPFVLRHYDAFRSPLLVTCFPQIVILKGSKNALWERRETGQWHGVKNLLPGWRLTAFLNTVADPSLALWMTPYRIPSFRAEVRMLYENEEKSQHDTERRIYYSDDTLRFSSSRVQILHIRSGWRLTSYARIMELAVRRSCWRT